MKKGRFKLPITAAKVDLGVRPLKVQFIEYAAPQRVCGAGKFQR
jgi:hypothetical protein